MQLYDILKGKNKMKLLHIIFVTVFFTGCSTNAKEHQKLGINTQGQSPVLHAIDSSELRTVMRRMKGLMFERNLTDQEMDAQRRRAYGEVLVAANGIDQAIREILNAKSKLNLQDSDMHVFERMAYRLKDEANNLKIQAQNQQPEEIQITLHNISQTCNACHTLFRDFSKKQE